MSLLSVITALSVLRSGRITASSFLKLPTDILAQVSLNPGLLALGELAGDLISGGPLNARAQLRHSGTHRFVILHDVLGSSRASAFVEHQEQSDFEKTTIETLQICRAAGPDRLLVDLCAQARDLERTSPRRVPGKHIATTP